MSRQLSDHEVFDLLDRNRKAASLVQQHEDLFGYYGWETWDQTRADVDQYGVELPIPPRGFVIEDDEIYGDVVIYPDAHGVLRYTSTENQSLVEEVKKPTYTSDPDYWELYEEIAAKYGEAADTLGKGLHSDLGLLLGLGLVVLIFVARR